MVCTGGLNHWQAVRDEFGRQAHGLSFEEACKKVLCLVTDPKVGRVEQINEASARVCGFDSLSGRSTRYSINKLTRNLGCQSMAAEPAPSRSQISSGRPAPARAR
jgi:hypothetical protein